MSTTKLKHLLLAPLFLTFVVLSSAIQCMQVPERNSDFEAIVKRGYYDFLDRVGKEKFKELGLEDPTERKVRIDFWDSQMNTMIEHTKSLYNDQMGYDDLLDLVIIIKKYYSVQEQVSLLKSKILMGSEEESNKLITELVQDGAWWLSTETREYKNYYQYYVEKFNEEIIRCNTYHGRINYTQYQPMVKSFRIQRRQIPSQVIEKIIRKKMEKYEQLQGSKHPLWEEFCQIER